MEFAEFADHVAAIESLDGDIERCERVADLLDVASGDLGTVVRLLLGRVFPAHQSTTLDIGPRRCYEALARAAGHNVDGDDVEARVASEGDVGRVAEQLDLGGQQGLGAFGAGDREALTVATVADRLETLAKTEGEGSEQTKGDILFDLFNRTDPLEARYLTRLVLEEMRIGVGEGTIRDATASAFDVPVEAIESALQVSNDYGLVAETARDDGVDALTEVSLAVGRPVQAMLAQTGAVGDAIESWGEVVVERKYDGARVQAHYDGDSVRLYSRNMEDVTAPLPEVVAGVEASLDVPAILDGEVVAVDDGGPLPFQEVLRRFRRKHDIARARENVEVRFHAFDCLHADGTDLLSQSLVDRHDRLAELVDAGDHVDTADPVVSDDPDEVAELEAEALEGGHEGIMLKNPESAYTPGKRGQNWLKRKPDVETLDCVVTGAEWGEGRRASLLGSFELSVRDGDGYATVGKVATGITDEELDRLTALLEEKIRAEDGAEVTIEPGVVFEVGYEEIQESTTYSSGYALRFPRFLGVREDKDPADADPLDRLESLADTQ
jgi:DNA ligase-1